LGDYAGISFEQIKPHSTQAVQNLDYHTNLSYAGQKGAQFCAGITGNYFGLGAIPFMPAINWLGSGLITATK